MNKISDKFFFIWVFFIPITSFVVIPSVRGSLFSYFLAIISPIIYIYKKKFFGNYSINIIKFIYFWLIFLCISQLANSIWNIDLTQLTLVHSIDYNIKLFRDSMFSQSLYLMLGFLTFCYVKTFYNEKWDKWIIYSGSVFAAYGIYEFIFFIIFNMNGDFLSNRIFNLGVSINAQFISLAGITFQRLDSLSPEPSMYAFTMLPFFIFSIHRGASKILIFLMGVSLLLTTSTTAYLGLFVYILYLGFFIKKTKRIYIFIFIMLLLIIMMCNIMYDYIYDVIQFMILNKLSFFDSSLAVGGSGIYSSLERGNNFMNNIDFWLNIDIIHKLFGIGFGFIRSTDLCTTLLINTGIIGMIIYCVFVLKNFLIKPKNFIEIGNNSIILVLFIIMMISVPEFGFLSFWLFLGIIYNKK